MKARTWCTDRMRAIANSFHVLVTNDILGCGHFILQSNHFDNSFSTTEF